MVRESDQVPLSIVDSEFDAAYNCSRRSTLSLGKPNCYPLKLSTTLSSGRLQKKKNLAFVLGRLKVVSRNTTSRISNQSGHPK